MDSKLAKLKEKLREQEAQKNNQGGGSDGALYLFWDIPDEATAIVRFLPDGNEDNPYFWSERRIIKMPFNGIKGQTDKKVIVDVPCMQMWGEQCPITEEIRDFWNDDNLRDIARTYYRKQNFIYQGFVVQDPLNEENPPENPIRRFMINKTLHEKIKASLLDDELDVMPVDYDEGIDFKIIKTKKAQYNNYDTSTWSRKSRSLSDEEREAIEHYGLKNLGDFLPKKPSEKDVEVMLQMYESSLNGEPYDPDRFAEHFRPYGLNKDGKSSGSSESSSSKKSSTPAKKATTTEPTPKEEATVEEDTVDEAETEETSQEESGSETKSNQSTEDLLNKIKSRQKSRAGSA